MRHTLRVVMWFLAITLLLAVLLFGFLNLPGPTPREDVSFGITFSNRYAEALGLDWRQTYIALLDELSVKKVRIPVYWDRVERARGSYDFSEIDWQLEEARKRNVEVVLAMGQRVPRWPECFIPDWAQQDDQTRKVSLLKVVQKTVHRYRDHTEVTVWQVENEPFLGGRFGICPPLDVHLLEQEVALVKAIDSSRPVLLTDSGELSVWVQAASRGDMFGTTLYRDLYHPRFGYMTYPLGPNFFLFKAWLVRTFAHQNNLVVIELQAEPWANGWVAHTSLEEQFITMDEQKLRANVRYARQLQFPEIYLWGAEWWYWLKEVKHYPGVWEEARNVFSE